jgi:hypothetical protein
MSHCRRATLIAMLTLAGAGAAHDTLPSENWCAPGRIAVVAHVTFSLEAVHNYANCAPITTCALPEQAIIGARAGAADQPSCGLWPLPADSCGEFDDDYGTVRRLTDSFCQQYTRQPIGAHVPDWGSVVADVIAPISTSNANSATSLFYDEYLHHQYVIGQQVELMCLRCEDVVNVPTN